MKIRLSASLTADIVAVDIDNNSVLLITRRGEPFMGLHALPGGYVNPGETFKQAAVREFLEEVSIPITPERLIFAGVYDEPFRDPRGRVVSVAYLIYLTEHEVARAFAGDDAATAEWVSLDKLPTLAFDHDQIIYDAHGSH